MSVGRLIPVFAGFFLMGASLALALGFVAQGDVAGLVAENRAPAGFRTTLPVVMSLAGLLAMLPPGLFLLLRRGADSETRLVRIAAIASPLLLACAVPLLFDWRAFAGRELLFAACAVLFGIALEGTFRLCLGALPVERSAAPGRAWVRLPPVLVGLLFLLFAFYFSFHTVQQHYNLRTQSYDLAVFDNLFWNLMRGEWFLSTPAMGPTGSHIQRHATFVAYLLLPFYALRERADALLVIQAVIAGAGAVPLFLLAKRVLASGWLALALAYAYVVYAPLHGPIFYDFHFLTLAPFFVFWVFYAFEVGSRTGLAAAVLAAMLVREDVSAGLAMGFLFYALVGKRVPWAVGGFVVSLLYFVCITFVVMPLHGGGSGSIHSRLYQGLIPPGEAGFGAVLRTVLTNPVYTLGTLLEPRKLLYLVELMAPLLFLPLRHGRTWVMLLFPAAATILSTGEHPVAETSFQYTAHWIPYLFVGAVYALGTWGSQPATRNRARAAAAALILMSTIFSYQRGAIFSEHGFRGGFRLVQLGRTQQDLANQADLYALIASIPEAASVAATENEAPHVSNRRDCFTLRYGHHDADYLLVDARKARGPSRAPLERALATQRYGLVAVRGHYLLWGRGHDTRDNSRGLRLLGLGSEADRG